MEDYHSEHPHSCLKFAHNGSTLRHIGLIENLQNEPNLPKRSGCLGH
jgi:hypothetical protein